MNAALTFALTFTAALVLITGEDETHPPNFNDRPCQRNQDNNAYNKFVQKHILQDSFNTKSKSEWERYLTEKRLCNRPKQSFVKGTDQSLVVEICSGSGRRRSGNLCTSRSPVLVHVVTADRRGCRVRRIEGGQRYVTVACDKIENRCLPVHFNGTQSRRPNSAEPCSDSPEENFFSHR